MNKKNKIIIAISVIVVIATLVGVLCWGLQPVIKDEVSLGKLNKKVGGRYCVPSQMPFEGDVECFVYYNEPAFGVILLRFEANKNKITGYTVELKDEHRYIFVDNRISSAIAFPEQNGPLTADYKNKRIEYISYVADDGNTTWRFVFYENDKTYTITAKYDKTVDGETLKKDIEVLLEQMIK